MGIVAGQPPDLLTTGRFILRRFEPGDAALVKEAIDSSLEHLREFMDWSWASPEPVEVVEERLRGFTARFESGQDYTYGLFSLDGREVLGGAGLHRRIGEGGLEVGYWVRASRLRQGLATESAAILTRVAFEECDVARTELRIDAKNSASLGVPPKLGYELTATVPELFPPVRPGLARRTAAIFTLTRERFPGSPCASAQYS